MDRDLSKILSENEKEVYDYMKEVGQVTVEDIERKCGKKAVGAIGKLLREEIIEKKKVKIGDGYGMKMKKVYKIKEKE